MFHFHYHCYLCKERLYFSSHGICCFCQKRLAKQPICCPCCGLAAESAQEPCIECQQMPSTWQRLIAIGDYERSLKRLVVDLKFNKKIALAFVLARLFLLRWLDLRRSQDVTKPDVLLSVPLHRYRYWQRGFNQTDLIANYLAHWLGCHYNSSFVIRVKKTPPQQNLNASQRQLNIANAFALNVDVTGKNVALFDDIVTTGSTVSEICRLLQSAGARQIQVWCICRTSL